MSPITTTAEAERAIDDLSALIDKLSGLMEQETALVHAGKVSRAVDLGQAKSELAHQLYMAGERLKANAKFLLQSTPARCAALQRVQEAFRAVLQKNLWRVGTGDGTASQIRPAARYQQKALGFVVKSASPGGGRRLQAPGAASRSACSSPRSRVV
jgi:hypothetical protein